MELTVGEMKRTKYIRQARRIVIKLGTKVLLSQHNAIERGRVGPLVEDIVALRQEGYEFIIVSSGAVGFGMEHVGLSTRPERLKKVQALAAIGQNLLMQDWHLIFSEKQVSIGQILLTYGVLEDRRRYLHAKDCLNALLCFGAIPIVNENDSVAVEELKFGDNDALSAITALLVDADLLVLFTDTDGVYDKNPSTDADAERIRFIEKIDDSLLGSIHDKNNGLSRGGMKSKLEAARRSQSSGTGVIIADGLNPELRRILNGEDVGTFVRPNPSRITAKKKWILFNTKPRGRIVVDEGATRALSQCAKSLLASGILRVEGAFSDGAVVAVCAPSGEIIARGVTYYSSADIERIKGKQTEEIPAIIGRNYYDEVIDRDNLILV